MAEEDTRLDEVREHFTLRKLQERVWRLEAENKELKVNNSILQTQFNSQSETQSDMLRTLHANLEENYSTIEKLEQEIKRLEEAIEDQKQEFKDELETKTEKWKGNVSILEDQIDKLQKALDAVNHFQLEKNTMEGELSSLRKQLQEQAEVHAQKISDFDRKKAIHIDQLKKDMQRSLKETREMLKSRTKDQLDSTTKRTIMENEQMATELHFQSKETERLLDRNKALLEENAQLRRNLLIHKDLENELARRTHLYQRLLKKMDQKQKADMLSQEQSRELGGSTLSELGRHDEEDSLAGGNSQSMAGGATEEGRKLQRQLEEQLSTLQMVRHEFAQYRRDHATLTQLQDQSTRLIIAALYELKGQKEVHPFPPATYDADADWQFTNMTGRQKEYFFRVLLEKLNSSMCGNCFPAGPPQTSSTTSLPLIGKGVHSHEMTQGNFSQFLWSVASHGGAQPQGQKDLVHRGCQTETEASDPCLQEGLWHPKARAAALTATPALVMGGVRNWGPRSVSQRRRAI